MLSPKFFTKVSNFGPRKRWLLSVAALALYFPLLLAAHSIISNVALAFMFLPALFWAALLGPGQAALLTLLLAIPNYMILRSMDVMSPGDETLQLIVAHLVIAAISYGAGTTFRLRERLARELTQRKSSDARFRGLFERNNDAVFISDANMIIVDANAEAARLLGYTTKELIGKPYRDLVVPEQRAAVDERINLERAGNRVAFSERTYLRKDGSHVTTEVSGALIQASDGAPPHFQTISRDITKRKAAQEQLYYQATHDSLTGLFNRAMLADLLARAIEHARRHNDQMAVLFIDLDNFKGVNDTLGHLIGDQLLKECSQRLNGLLRKSDVIARVGGDEFTVLLEPIMEKVFAEKVADNIVKALSAPFVLGGNQIEISASVGISMFPGDAQDAEGLLSRADQLMYKAKQKKKQPRPQ